MTPGIDVLDLDAARSGATPAPVKGDSDAGTEDLRLLRDPEASEASVGTIGRDRYREFGW